MGLLQKLKNKLFNKKLVVSRKESELFALRFLLVFLGKGINSKKKKINE